MSTARISPGNRGSFTTEAFTTAIENYYAINPHVPFASGGVARIRQLDQIVRAAGTIDGEKSISQLGAISWAALEIGAIFEESGQERAADNYFSYARQVFETSVRQYANQTPRNDEEIRGYTSAPFALSCFALIHSQEAPAQQDIAEAQFHKLGEQLTMVRSLKMPEEQDLREIAGMEARQTGFTLASRAGYLLAPSSARQARSTHPIKPLANWQASVWKIREDRPVSFATPPDIRLRINNRRYARRGSVDQGITQIALVGDVFQTGRALSMAALVLREELTGEPVIGSGAYAEGFDYLEEGQARLAVIFEQAIDSAR